VWRWCPSQPLHRRLHSPRQCQLHSQRQCQHLSPLQYRLRCQRPRRRHQCRPLSPLQCRHLSPLQYRLRCLPQRRLHSPRHTRRGRAFSKLIVTLALGAKMISWSSVLPGGHQPLVAKSRHTARQVLGQCRRRLHLQPQHRHHSPPHSRHSLRQCPHRSQHPRPRLRRRLRSPHHRQPPGHAGSNLISTSASIATTQRTPHIASRMGQQAIAQRRCARRLQPPASLRLMRRRRRKRRQIWQHRARRWLA